MARVIALSEDVWGRVVLLGMVLIAVIYVRQVLRHPATRNATRLHDCARLPGIATLAVMVPMGLVWATVSSVPAEGLPGWYVWLLLFLTPGWCGWVLGVIVVRVVTRLRKPAMKA